MKWLLIGITRKEIREKQYTLPTTDFVTFDRGDFGPFRKGDIDFKHDAFDVQAWRRILSIFGPNSFDVIFTDGGLFGIKRVEEIVRIKGLLLKGTGCAVNYSSPIGTYIPCPFGRKLHFKMIPQTHYTVENMDEAFSQLQGNGMKHTLMKQMMVII